MDRYTVLLWRLGRSGIPPLRWRGPPGVPGVASVFFFLGAVVGFAAVVVVAATTAGSYEERACMRCLEGRVYDIRRGAWVTCERGSGTALVVVYLYPKLKGRPR